MNVHTRHDRLDTVLLDMWRTNYGRSSKYVIGPRGARIPPRCFTLSLPPQGST